MSKTKSRLGRGLSSLLASPAMMETDDESPAIQPPPHDSTGLASDVIARTIPLNQISPNRQQPRKQFNEAAIEELAASIKTNGLIQPVLVKPLAEGGYELVAGERRWRAAKIAGLTDLPALIRNIDPLTQAQLALIENIQREDLNPIDRAQAYQFLMQQLGLTQNDLATRLAEDRSTIANFLRLLDLVPSVREMLIDGRLSASHAKILAGIPAADQQRLADITVGQGLSVRNLERLSQQPPQATPSSPKPTPSAHIQELERSIARQVGLRAQIHAGSKGKGRLILHYSSLDQFDTLLDRLGIKSED